MRTYRSRVMAALAAAALVAALAVVVAVPAGNAQLPACQPGQTNTQYCQQVAAAQLVLQCQNRSLVLIDVVQQGKRALLTGAADRRFNGQRVNIVFGPRHVLVARPLVVNGLFQTFVPLPPKNIRDTNLARYQAQLRGQVSLNLKFRRRMIVISLTSTPGVVHLRGRVLPPLLRHPAIIRIQRRISCSTLVTEKTVKPNKQGFFSVNLQAPPALQAAIYRAATFVLKFAHSPNKHFPTFTLPRVVDLLH